MHVFIEQQTDNSHRRRRRTALTEINLLHSSWQHGHRRCVTICVDPISSQPTARRPHAKTGICRCEAALLEYTQQNKVAHRDCGAAIRPRKLRARAHSAIRCVRAQRSDSVYCAQHTQTHTHMPIVVRRFVDVE